jgi:hypothetical protein
VPRRKRINKRRDQLTLQRDMLLLLGPNPRQPCPEPGDEEWEALRACWEAHRDRYSEDSWGYLAFELGDVEGALRANELVPVDADENEPVD